MRWLQVLVIGFTIVVFNDAAQRCPSFPQQNHWGHVGFLNESELSTPEECARMCVDGEPPKTCYWSFHLELYSVMGPACDLCLPTNTNQLVQDCECVTSDGVETMIVAVNRMMPGPSIQVCYGDKVVVDMFNNIEGQETSIHWHGILQKGSQYYDGVPMVTQCPVKQGNNFRYQFIARDAGTQFWHSHVGLQKMNGMTGSLIVREPPSMDASYDYYDYDLTTNVMLIQDMFHTLSEDRYPGRFRTNTGQKPDNFLINGRGQYVDPTTNISTTTPLEEFTLKPGFRYRFRIITATCGTCPVQITIENHNMTVIEIDGEPIEPVVVTSINVFPGERYDMVLHTNQTIGTYWIHLIGLHGCASSKMQQLGKIIYEGSDGVPATSAPTYGDLAAQVVLNPLDALCNVTRSDAICINQLNNSRYIPVDEEVLLTQRPDHQIYLPVKFRTFTKEDLFTPGNPYLVYDIPPGGGLSAAQIDNITYTPPPSPLLSQIKDIDPSRLCNGNRRPNCTENCTCTHVVNIKLNSICEIIIVDLVGNPFLSHPFHLHGFSFHVVAEGLASDLNVTKISTNCVKDNDKAGNIKRRSIRAPRKDVIAVPSNGYVVFRFRADNPGYWFMHCHFVFHSLVGMDLVLHVGEQSDLPPIPQDFPKCGNFATRISANPDSVY